MLVPQPVQGDGIFQPAGSFRVSLTVNALSGSTGNGNPMVKLRSATRPFGFRLLGARTSMAAPVQPLCWDFKIACSPLL